MGERQNLDGLSFANVPRNIRRSMILDFVRRIGIDPNEVTVDGLRIDHDILYITLAARHLEKQADYLPSPSSAILTHTFEIYILDDNPEAAT
jgi:hypothetical protein